MATISKVHIQAFAAAFRIKEFVLSKIK